MPDTINFDNVTFTYPAYGAEAGPALSHVALTIHSGESISLIGSNGSGKSTLAKLMNALLLPDSGQVTVFGMDSRDPDKQFEIRSQVGLVFQRPQHQIVATTVEEDVAFGPGNLGLEPGEVRARVEDALQRTGLENYHQRYSFQLSAGETQRLALAGVLAMHPRCIIFDETTAMLDPLGREMVMAQIQELNQRGITTILITHLMEEAAMSERVIVLHHGRLVLDDSAAAVFSGRQDLGKFDLDLPPVVRAASILRKAIPEIPEGLLKTGNLLRSLPEYQGSYRPAQSDGRQQKAIEDCIAIHDLSFTYMQGSPLAHRALNTMNLQVGRGQIHALIGSTGSGKSTILQHINGLIRPQSGSVRVEEMDLADSSLDVQALRRRTALAFQQPEDQIFEQYVGDEIAYAPRHLGYEGKLSEVVRKAMEAVGLDFEAYKDRLTSNLSGGEKRKVALASILAIQSDILLLDEPLSGLDPFSTGELLQTLSALHQEGKTLLISTHQYEEFISLLNDVTVINKGQDRLHGSAASVFSRVGDLESAGLKAPLAARIASQLREKGWPIAEQTVSFSQLESQLTAITRGVSL